MKRKRRQAGFDDTLDLLRARGFDVKQTGATEGVLVSKYGAGAVLVSGAEGPEFEVRPGALLRGEVARLVDRGFQKFFKSSQYELPASAQLLEDIHAFSEELKELAGGKSLYNESLGTTSDNYLYDRLRGREQEQSKGVQPWDPAGAH